MIYENLAKKLIEILRYSIEKKTFFDQVNNVAKEIKDIDKLGKIVVIFGNGGSAADSQHFAGELMCTYKNKGRKPYKAIALTTDTSILTAWSNDFSYDSVFERQIEAFDKQIGLAIGLSTSGKSKNVIRGLEKAHKLGIKTCFIRGICDSKELDLYHNFLIEIPSKDTEIIQTITQVIYHSICQELENK